MNILSGQPMCLLDLPNEILLIIIEYLSMIEVFHSLVGITERLDQLVLHPILTRTLKMTCLKMELLPDRVYSLDERALATLCPNVLPRIRQHITQLVVDQFAIDAVFHATEYSELRSLSLIDMDEHCALELSQGGGVLYNLLSDQITSLTIDLTHNSTDEPPTEYYSTIFSSLLKSCQRLTKFHFCSFDYGSPCRWVEFSVLNCQSAILTDLKVRTTSFRECLYLFAGHFPSLSTVAITVDEIGRMQSMLENAKPLHNLKSFSLSSSPRTFWYDDLIVPLLRRMINLEELSLDLAVIRTNSGFVDGVQLRDDILQHMPRLSKFNFNVETTIIKSNSDLVLPSNDDIQRSFIGGPFRSVGSHVDVFAKASGSRAHAYSLSHHFYSRCHIYSLPYKFVDFPFLSNSFQSGIFERVRVLSVADVQPCEHELFRIISQSFPALVTLHILNEMPQENEQSTETMITFARLQYLNVHNSHVDYATQFLINEHCQLPRLQKLGISWASLVSVTNDFTNDATRHTCSQVKHLCIREPIVRPERFHGYFSSL